MVSDKRVCPSPFLLVCELVQLVILLLSAPLQRRIQRKPQEFPIFKREDAKFSIQSGITHIAVSNGYVTIVMVGNVIYRFSAHNPRTGERE